MGRLGRRKEGQGHAIVCFLLLRRGQDVSIDDRRRRGGADGRGFEGSGWWFGSKAISILGAMGGLGNWVVLRGL